MNALRKSRKFSVSDPINFEESWTFQSTWQRVLSLIVLIVILFCGLTFYLFVLGPFSGLYSKDDVSIERKKLEEQAIEIDRANKKIEAQEKYVARLRKIANGEVPIVSNQDSSLSEVDIDFKKINPNLSPEEQALADEVRNDMRTVDQNELNYDVSFIAPAVGVVSQNYTSTHNAIDIVLKEGTEVRSCQSGTVVYSGYSSKDGYMIIITHNDEFISIYKHNKKLLKKQGDMVRQGDPIALSGSSGENSSGPHLHFELWRNGKPLDSQKYIRFTR